MRAWLKRVFAKQTLAARLTKTTSLAIIVEGTSKLFYTCCVAIRDAINVFLPLSKQKGHEAWTKISSK